MRMTRRQFLSTSAILIGGVAAACGPAATPPATDPPAASQAPLGTPSAAPPAAQAKGRAKQGQPVTPSPSTAAVDTAPVSEILGQPAAKSVTANVLAQAPLEVYLEYGAMPGVYSGRSAAVSCQPGPPCEIAMSGLPPNATTYYRTRYRQPGAAQFATGPEKTLHTQRAPGSTFTFAIQGDSHPERANQHDSDLYRRTLLAARADNPDFYMTIGDDDSVDTLKTVNAQTVDQVYLHQRSFLELVQAPAFLVNGNHEQAAAYLLDGTPNNVAVWAQNARNRYFPQPAPDSFYTGDGQQVQHIGLLRDYYAWTWGDALFVVIDPYWHSPVAVDNVYGGGPKTSDEWSVTIGNAQYQWLKTTLEQSKATYKFVFTHHVLGTGRGGTDMADQYEWGGKGKSGAWEFTEKRPGWAMPIHQLMAKNGVTIFFQGHDHIFVRQEKDGVIYQTLPEPADPSYTLYNADAYKTGVKLSNTGYVRVTVSSQQVKVDYVRIYLPKDETGGHKSGEIAYSYTVTPRRAGVGA
jgi:hypothetical protein